MASSLESSLGDIFKAPDERILKAVEKAGNRYDPVCVFFFYLLSSPVFSLHPSRNSDPINRLRVRVTKQALLPPPHYGTRLLFYREKSSALSSSLVDSRRIVLTHAI
ncbi:unnamed protein product, partial [Laminaria digitata]